MNKKNLVYLSYGNEREYKRTIFSILSFYTWCDSCLGSTRIIIYTDSPNFFQSYLNGRNIEYFYLTQTILKEMSGNEDFNHRRKVLVIDLTFKRYPVNDVVFIDSDTFFIENAQILLNKFESKKSFMHTREYRIKDAPSIFAVFNQEHFPKKFIENISGKAFKIGEELVFFSGEDYSWNSGVLGLSSDFSFYMPDVLNLTDDFYANSKWFISEQLAFSFILQRKTEIFSADGLIYHYWGKRQKELMDKLLVDYLSNGTTSFNKKQLNKNITTDCKKRIENDLILEQIEIAVSLGSLSYAVKKSIEIILKNRFNISLYKELVLAFKHG